MGHETDKVVEAFKRGDEPRENTNDSSLYGKLSLSTIPPLLIIAGFALSKILSTSNNSFQKMDGGLILFFLGGPLLGLGLLLAYIGHHQDGNKLLARLMFGIISILCCIWHMQL